MATTEKEKDEKKTKSTNKIILRERAIVELSTKDLNMDMDQQQQPTFDVDYGGTGGKFDKLAKNPLVPIGAAVTAGVLIAGLFSMRSGNTRLSQQLMRARVLAQGATLGVLTLSVVKMQSATNNDQETINPIANSTSPSSTSTESTTATTS